MPAEPLDWSHPYQARFVLPQIQCQGISYLCNEFTAMGYHPDVFTLRDKFSGDNSNNMVKNVISKTCLFLWQPVILYIIWLSSGSHKNRERGRSPARLLPGSILYHLLTHSPLSYIESLERHLISQLLTVTPSHSLYLLPDVSVSHIWKRIVSIKTFCLEFLHTHILSQNRGFYFSVPWYHS